MDPLLSEVAFNAAKNVIVLMPSRLVFTMMYTS